MRFTWTDTATTVLVAAIVVPYVGYLVRGAMPFVQDPVGMAATGLVLGIAAAMLVVRRWLDPGVLQRTALLTGTVALGLGIAVLWTVNEALLAAFVGAIVVTWALGELIHVREHPAAQHGPAGPTATGHA
ncbi:hypothetical protein ACL02T_08925 [Pseudonocardia sp. RS010]|uniref:hypothetical protein n=1 Tax=Pseudonocardia sp. RS010 TaxID=3385979 RepID=UPI0039A21682